MVGREVESFADPPCRSMCSMQLVYLAHVTCLAFAFCRGSPLEFDDVHTESQLGRWWWLICTSFHGQLAALPAMVLDSLGGDWGTAKVLLTHQAQLVVHHPQMVDNGSFILCFLPTPWAWVTPLKWWSALGWWMLVKPMTLGDSEGDNRWKTFNPLGKDLRAWLAYCSTCHPVQFSLMSWTSERRRL